MSSIAALLTFFQLQTYLIIINNFNKNIFFLLKFNKNCINQICILNNLVLSIYLLILSLFSPAQAPGPLI